MAENFGLRPPGRDTTSTSKGDSSGFSAGNPGLKESAARLQPPSSDLKCCRVGRVTPRSRFFSLRSDKTQQSFSLLGGQKCCTPQRDAQPARAALTSCRAASHSMRQWNEIKRLVPGFDQIWSFSRRMCENEGTDRPVFYTVG